MSDAPFTAEEQAAIADAVAAGKVKRVENWCWPDALPLKWTLCGAPKAPKADHPADVYHRNNYVIGKRRLDEGLGR